MKTLLFEESPEFVYILFILMIVFKKYNIIFFLSTFIFIMLCVFFRLPVRNTLAEGDDTVITSPSDGTILSISIVNSGDSSNKLYDSSNKLYDSSNKLYDSSNKLYDSSNKLYKITIYLSIFDVHTQWFPVSGKITSITRKEGEFNLAHILEKSEYNERFTTIIQPNKIRGSVRIDQIAGQVARRIVNWSKKNTNVNRGDLLGMIKLSSRVDLYLPVNNVRLHVKKGDNVKGNETSIGTWNV
jgi:phosphatidylserine decarboxylase